MVQCETKDEKDRNAGNTTLGSASLLRVRKFPVIVPSGPDMNTSEYLMVSYFHLQDS